MLSDIELARQCRLEKITDIACNLGLNEEDIETYGYYKAKISAEKLRTMTTASLNGKLILVTAVTPTPAGEGKTTVSIGLADGLRKIGKKAMLALREPSLGPCFGLKGGATGGGRVQIAPMEDINLHFTGDIHAVTAATNLLAALIDNHIKHGNALNIDPQKIFWHRSLDLNDRSLRQIEIALGGPINGTPRKDSFDISVASEIMAILCLSEDLADLKRRLKRIIVAQSFDRRNITADDLKAVGAMAVLLKDALRPNLVQTLEHTPALVHGGPFANIAHGCNSVIATKTALRLADYVVTEAGFGADLGAEKFLDIKCPSAGLTPHAVVLVATIRALKMHGGVAKDSLTGENLSALEKGFANLRLHYENLQKFGLPVVVALNCFSADTPAEIKLLQKLCTQCGFSAISVSAWEHGGSGAVELAEAVVNAVQQPSGYHPLYSPAFPLRQKIHILATQIYRAGSIEYSENASRKLDELQQGGFGNLPVCIAKTQNSVSDNPKLLGAPENHVFHVNDVRLSAGAGFVVILSGSILTMPGLPAHPAAENIDITDDGIISGLF